MRLKLKNIKKTFGTQGALKDISFDIPQCQTLALLGSSGSGKSTLLRILSGLEIPDEGIIDLNDTELSFQESSLLQYRRTVGTVFQNFNLFPHLTALDNIVLPLHRVHGKPREAAQKWALKLLTRFGLDEHALKKPAALSGGQRQRVAIIRAIAIQAQLIIMDEPTSALDPLMTAEVLDLITELRAEGKDIILSSHHVSFVKKTADWVVFLEEGSVIECSPTNLFFSSPQTAAAQRFLEKVLRY